MSTFNEIELSTDIDHLKEKVSNLEQSTLVHLHLTDPQNFDMDYNKSKDSPLRHVLCSCIGKKFDLSPTDFSNNPCDIILNGTFLDCKNLVKIGQLPHVSSYIGTFENCHALETVDWSIFDKAEYLDSTFQNCDCPTIKVDGSYFGNVDNAHNAFNGMSNLIEIYNPSFDKIIKANGMFDGCRNLKHIDTSFDHLRAADSMFKNCSSLEKIDTSYFGDVETASEIFYNCNSLKEIIDFSFFRYCDNLSFAFAHCNNLQQIDGSCFHSVTNATCMCMGTPITSFNSSCCNLVKSANDMFRGCKNLKYIDLSNFKSISDASNMFKNCTNLDSISLDIFSSSALDDNAFNSTNREIEDAFFALKNKIKDVDLFDME